jgi:hypothetical protein
MDLFQAHPLSDEIALATGHIGNHVPTLQHLGCLVVELHQIIVDLGHQVSRISGLSSFGSRVTGEEHIAKEQNPQDYDDGDNLTGHDPIVTEGPLSPKVVRPKKEDQSKGGLEPRGPAGWRAILHFWSGTISDINGNDSIPMGRRSSAVELLNRNQRVGGSNPSVGSRKEIAGFGGRKRPANVEDVLEANLFYLMIQNRDKPPSYQHTSR